MVRLVLGCLLYGAAPAPLATAAEVSAWDAYVSAHAANGDFSGIVLVSRHGQREYEKVAGLASRSLDVPLRADSRYIVASVTKTFTAAGIALLQDQGKLKIEDSLERYLPDSGTCSATRRGWPIRSTTRSQRDRSRPTPCWR